MKKKNWFKNQGMIVNTNFEVEINVTAGYTFTFPCSDLGVVDAFIDFGDGSGTFAVSTYNDTNFTHTYTNAGLYTVVISGNSFGGVHVNNTAVKTVFKNIKNWGTFIWYQLNFYGCSNMIITATDIPNTSQLSSMLRSFYNCSSITTIPNINNWDTSFLTSGALTDTFRGCTNFNDDVSNWSTITVTSFAQTFMSTKYNYPLTNWNVSYATNLGFFLYATPYNQDLTWCTPTLCTNMSNFLGGGSGVDTIHYDNFLIHLDSLASLQLNVTLTMGTSKYTLGGAAEAAKASIISKWNWTITDGGGI